MPYDVLVDLTSLDSPSRYSGTGRYVFELGLALGALSPSERAGLSFGALTALEGPEPTGPLGWPGSPELRYEHELAWLTRRRLHLPFTLRRLRPRLFHVPYQMGTPRGSFVPRVVSCLDLVPLVLHQDYLAGRPIYRRLLMAAEALRYHSACRVLAISQNTADDLIRVLHVPAKKIDVALLGVDLERYHPFVGAEAEQARAARARHRLREGGYVFYLGRADPRKNVDVVVKAFAAAQVDGLELVIIGKMRPSDERVFAQAMQAAGHPPGVRFLGFVPEDDLPAIIEGALAFVFCSTYEGFGNVPVEAMACGCPVIHTGTTSLRETVADAGLRVPPRNVEATAAAIRRLATEPTLHRDLRAAGLKRAADFSWRNTALGTVACYERALAGLS
jgi:glycosyltransferase involved in cell wall biosynthesis